MGFNNKIEAPAPMRHSGAAAFDSAVCLAHYPGERASPKPPTIPQPKFRIIIGKLNISKNLLNIFLSATN